MEKIPITYRCWDQGVAPQPIKLQIPGWAGDKNAHTDGDVPQPWHCTPYVEGATYGLELIYTFDGECHVTINDGKVVFSGDFANDAARLPHMTMPPFSTFAPGHFGMSSCLDIKVPDGYVLRTEPHPRYYTDHTNTVPCCLPGHLATAWWPKIFFVVFKNPLPNQTLIFRKGEPFGQILILPQRVSYDIKQMSSDEAFKRNFLDENINKYAGKIAKNDWHDYLGHNFNDKYKVLNNIFVKKGLNGVNKFLDEIDQKFLAPQGMRFKTKPIIRKNNERLSDQEKK